MVTVVSQRTSPVQHLGIATAVPVMLRSLGGAGGVALLAALLVHRVEAEMATVTAVAADAPAGLASPALAQALTGAHGHGLRSVFLIAGLAVLGAGLCTRWLPARLTPAADGAGRPAARPAA